MVLKQRTELEWMRRMPQARGHKARYREEAFYELEKVAKQRFNDGNVKLAVIAPLTVIVFCCFTSSRAILLSFVKTMFLQKKAI